jgi:two-component system LytT family response regulator
MELKVLIVEDVEPVAMHLAAEIMDSCPGIEKIEVAGSVLEGLKQIKRMKPDILFLDVDLGDSNGFDLLDLLPPDLELPIIFTTGSEEHAIKAFGYGALDYLLKPVERGALQRAFERALKGRSTIRQLRKEAAPRDRIALHTQESIEIIPIETVLHCESDGGYTIFYLADGRKHIVSNTLKTYAEMFEGMGFLRVHQSHLVNFSKVRSYIKAEGGYLELLDGSRVPVSHRKKALVMQMLDQYL